VSGGCVLNGTWIFGTHELNFGRHSATFQYSTSNYSNTTTLSAEGMRISVIFVRGTGYINLECEQCVEGLLMLFTSKIFVKANMVIKVGAFLVL
jgi:hypothetical protein